MVSLPWHPNISFIDIGALPNTLFVHALMQAESKYLRTETWAYEKFPEKIDATLLFERINGSERYGIFYHTNPCGLVYIYTYSGRVYINFAGKDKVNIDGLSKLYRELIPRAEAKVDQVPFGFWTGSTNRGANLTSRYITVPSWEEIIGNYVEDVRLKLGELISNFSPDDSNSGHLMLWHGHPGTGKTYAIRALSREWAKWCRFQYVTDPEQLFSRADYLVDVLASSDEIEDIDDPSSIQGALESEVIDYLTPHRPKKKIWRVLVMEDTGEILRQDAKETQGQGLSRILNVIDGILGQGSKVMLLITTNEELEKLHPAVIRPGRCVAKIGFPDFPAAEANAWLEKRKMGIRVNTETSLAELYSLSRPRASFTPREERRQKIGF